MYLDYKMVQIHVLFNKSKIYFFAYIQNLEVWKEGCLFVYVELNTVVLNN
jgi:hypothetical protein